MELLAPAGNVENFLAAIEAGADSVYIGAPGINARNLSRDLTLEEIGGMIRYGHEKGCKVYLAANSLILEGEVSHALRTLAALEELGPDALIVQDLALLHLAQHHFPGFSLHASTLLGAHNSDITYYLSELGCSRVVLARELTLEEILSIAERTQVELEVFVHGAMCYSYSGLCLFSSFLGGKSGLRGRCVQPCRRAYGLKKGKGKKGTKGSRGGRTTAGQYLFSMNDLEGFRAVKSLQKSGVASLKIEGRLRSANYVSKIVQAYRLVLDADSSRYEDALREAGELAVQALGRKTSEGYFHTSFPQDLVAPHHSGNLGLHLGSFKSLRSSNDITLGKIRLKNGVEQGDRLRLHFEKTGDRKSFTLRQMHHEGKEVPTAQSGHQVSLMLPGLEEHLITSKVELYKIDGAEELREKGDFEKRKKEARIQLNAFRVQEKRRRGGKLLFDDSVKPPPLAHRRKGRIQLGRNGVDKALKMDVWLRADSPRIALAHHPFQPDFYLFDITREMVTQASKIKKHYGKNSHRIIWSLPLVVHDHLYHTVRKQIITLIRMGFARFQISHRGQVLFFHNQRVRLFGNYSLNISNSLALESVAQDGLLGSQVAIELDRDALFAMVSKFHEKTGAQERSGRKDAFKIGLTVYGAPPLFTTRFPGNNVSNRRPLVSPKGEEFVVKQKQGSTITVPVKPFSLLPYLHDIKRMGIHYVVVDTTSLGDVKHMLEELAQRMAGGGTFKKLPTFNYLGKLV